MSGGSGAPAPVSAGPVRPRGPGWAEGATTTVVPVPAPASHPATERPRPPLLTVVGVLVVLEGIVLVAAAAYLVHGLVTEPATEPVAAVFLAVMALGFAAALVFCGRALLQRASWARSPVIVWQVLQLAAGLPAFSGGAAWIAVVLVVPPVVVLVGLFTPAVSAEVSRH